MSTSYSGDSITFPDASTQASAQVGMKNRVIDGGFILNQRVYVSGTSLASGVYGHDRWKGGASGGTYTFTQGALGVNTTITITAGSLIHVIEGCNVAEGGTYVLSWAGTAQGRLNGGSYGTSGTVTVTGWTAGTNLNVEFNTGTCGSVQLEKGSTATSFDYRPYGTELALCQRYYAKLGANPQGSSTYQAYGAGGNTNVNTAQNIHLSYPQFMRASPTVAFSGNIGVTVNATYLNVSLAAAYGGVSSSLVQTLSAAIGSAGQGAVLISNGDATAFISLTAEL